MLLNAVIVGLVYWIVNIDCPLLMMCRAPLFLGGFFGLLWGDLKTGIEIGALLEAMYLGVVAVGANLPSDSTCAACISIPLAINQGMDINAAVALAVPFGILGAFLDNFRRTVNAMWWHRAEKAVDELDFKKFNFDATIGPALVQFPIRFIPLFIISYFGAQAATFVVDVMPLWLRNGFAVAGGLLPAVGFTLAIKLIGGKELIPFFALGFFILKVQNIPLVLMCIFGVILAVLYVQFTNKPEELDD